MKSQALSKTQARMQELEIEPKRSLGQNFLVDDQIIERIISAAKKFSAPAVIEIGPGLGSLSDHLILISQHYSAIELDRKFAKYWSEKGLQVYEEDALRFRWDRLPMLESTLLVSNLPYQISSSLLVDRSIDEKSLLGMVLMFQKEVGLRITAKPKTSDYGLLSVIAQMSWDITLVSDASPRAFLPPPNVASRVLSFRRRESAVVNKPEFLRFVKAAFAQRRKLLFNNLIAKYKSDKPRLESAFQSVGLLPTARAEELALKQFVDLYNKIR